MIITILRVENSCLEIKLTSRCGFDGTAFRHAFTSQKMVIRLSESAHACNCWVASPSEAIVSAGWIVSFTSGESSPSKSLSKKEPSPSSCAGSLAHFAGFLVISVKINVDPGIGSKAGSYTVLCGTLHLPPSVKNK
jgi:hypothetical protein